MTGLHVGLVGPLPPPYGGMANQTRQLAGLLQGEGLTVTLVRTNADYRPQWVAGVPVIRAMVRMIPYLLALWRTAGRCDVLHVMANSGWSWYLFATPAIWIARVRRKPVVVNYRGGEAESFFLEATRFAHMTLRKASKLIVPSGFLRAVFSRMGAQAEIVPNIVDLAHFNNPSPHRPIRRHFLVARNLEPIYDNETAIRAFARVHREFPDATLTIAGSGPLAAALKLLAENEGVGRAVVFAGRLDRERMADAYRKADVAINPSLVDNMPNSVLEALGSGVPVISTNVGGVPFIVRHEKTALLVPAGRVEDMAKAMLRLMTDAMLCENLINNGLAEANKYTWQQVWPVLADVYSQATACRQN